MVAIKNIFIDNQHKSNHRRNFMTENVTISENSSQLKKDEIYFDRVEHSEKNTPYDEDKLIQAAGEFFENHPFIKELN